MTTITALNSPINSSPKPEKNDTPYFDQIPNDLLRHIFSFAFSFDPHSFLYKPNTPIPLVCKRFQNMVLQPYRNNRQLHIKIWNNMLKLLKADNQDNPYRILGSEKEFAEQFNFEKLCKKTPVWFPTWRLQIFDKIIAENQLQPALDNTKVSKENLAQIFSSQVQACYNFSKNQLYSLIRRNHPLRDPPQVAEMWSITQLDLSNSHISALSPEIGELTCLTHLDLHDNQLLTLPHKIGNIRTLQLLSLANNNLLMLPTELGNLTNLEILFLFNNHLTNLPIEFCKLIRLKQLDLGNNNLFSLPNKFDNLKSLTQLSLFNNNLTNLHVDFAKLMNLSTLNLGDNQLHHLPPSLSKLFSLSRLNLNNNPISKLPTEFGWLSELEILYLSNTLMPYPPREIRYLCSRKLHSFGISNATLNIQIENDKAAIVKALAPYQEQHDVDSLKTHSERLQNMKTMLEKYYQYLQEF